MARPYTVTVSVTSAETDEVRRRDWTVPEDVVLTNARLAPVGTWVIQAVAQLDNQVVPIQDL